MSTMNPASPSGCPTSGGCTPDLAGLLQAVQLALDVQQGKVQLVPIAPPPVATPVDPSPSPKPSPRREAPPAVVELDRRLCWFASLLEQVQDARNAIEDHAETTDAWTQAEAAGYKTLAEFRAEVSGAEWCIDTIVSLLSGNVGIVSGKARAKRDASGAFADLHATAIADATNLQHSLYRLREHLEAEEQANGQREDRPMPKALLGWEFQVEEVLRHLECNAERDVLEEGRKRARAETW